MEKPPQIMNWMKWGVISVRPPTTIEEAAKLIVEKRIGTLPVVDEAGVLVGVVSLRDVIQIFLPDFVSLLADIDINFVKDYGNLGAPAEEQMGQALTMTIADIMHEPVAVEGDSSLTRALAVMENHNLRDICVVTDGVLVGIASEVDIGRAFLAHWGYGELEGGQEKG